MLIHEMPKCQRAAVYKSGITVLHTTEAKSNAPDLLCFQDELSLDAADDSQLDVLGVTTALQTAAHDPRIKAVLLDLSGSSYSGSATIMEVRRLLHFCTERCSSAYVRCDLPGALTVALHDCFVSSTFAGQRVLLFWTWPVCRAAQPQLPYML